ncbi:uncharacterized protein A4U43_C03F24960 [Asparagus officinalis]|uniref:Uncharacterized protein n=1 Tax=Asparagus officinalis TaxID=4686 RepID=A0A5P1FCR9_ASPOF|nr:uncharacterized protein A4U43_C03F24960 [Asparagus officinalis]
MSIITEAVWHICTGITLTMVFACCSTRSFRRFFSLWGLVDSVDTKLHRFPESLPRHLPPRRYKNDVGHARLLVPEEEAGDGDVPIMERRVVRLHPRSQLKRMLEVQVGLGIVWEEEEVVDGGGEKEAIGACPGEGLNDDVDLSSSSMNPDPPPLDVPSSDLLSVHAPNAAP